MAVAAATDVQQAVQLEQPRLVFLGNRHFRSAGCWQQLLAQMNGSTNKWGGTSNLDSVSGTREHVDSSWLHDLYDAWNPSTFGAVLSSYGGIFLNLQVAPCSE